MTNSFEAIDVDASSSGANSNAIYNDDNNENETIELLDDNDSVFSNIPTIRYQMSYPNLCNVPIPTSNYLSYEHPRMTIVLLGKPHALARSRFFRRGIFNPSGQNLRNCKQFLISSMASKRIELVPFPSHQPVQVKVFFFMKRPLSHFVGGHRTPGNLRNEHRAAPFINWVSQPTGPDIDNLTKFILDAMNKIIFQDDRQVVKLEAYKLLDCNGLCLGRTEVLVQLAAISLPGFWHIAT